MDRRGRRSKRSARYRDLGKAPAIRRPPLPRARPFAPAPAIPIQPVPTQPERRQPVRYQFGKNVVFVGSKAAKVFTPDFLERLAEAWQKKLRQPPITMFISIDGEKSPALDKALNEIASKPLYGNRAGLQKLKDTVSASCHMFQNSITVSDKKARPVACAINVDVTKTVKESMYLQLKIPRNIPPENVPDPEFTKDGYNMRVLAHEYGHCGTSYTRKGRILMESPSVVRESIADRFAADFIEDNPHFFPGMSRETVRQMRAVEAIHSELVHFNKKGSRFHQTHLTSFALREYDDILKFSDPNGYKAMQDGLDTAVWNIVNRVATPTSPGRKQKFDRDDVRWAVRTKNIDPTEYHEYTKKSNLTGSIFASMLVSTEDRTAVEGYEKIVQAWQSGRTEPNVSDSAQGLIDRMIKSYAPQIAFIKQRRGLYNDPQAFARKVNELHQNEEFGRGNQTAELAGLYVEGIKKFLPDWLEDKNKLEAGNKPEKQPKAGQDQRAGTMPIR